MSGLASLESGDARFDDSNFEDNARGNPGAEAKIDYLYSSMTDPGCGHYHNPVDYDAMMMKFCYIDDACSGFSSVTEMFEYHRDRINELQTMFPGTVIVWWTMPICTTGNTTRDQYNTLIRYYCRANNRILFDIADIESHDPAGNAVTDSTGEYMYSAYSDEGGHLNSTGALRMAKAFWMLAYRISLQ